MPDPKDYATYGSSIAHSYISGGETPGHTGQKIAAQDASQADVHSQLLRQKRLAKTRKEDNTQGPRKPPCPCNDFSPAFGSRNRRLPYPEENLRSFRPPDHNEGSMFRPQPIMSSTSLSSSLGFSSSQGSQGVSNGSRDPDSPAFVGAYSGPIREPIPKGAELAPESRSEMGDNLGAFLGKDWGSYDFEVYPFTGRPYGYSAHSTSPSSASSQAGGAKNVGDLVHPFERVTLPLTLEEMALNTVTTYDPVFGGNRSIFDLSGKEESVN
ncbi:hypothetical protein NliqN6_1556 [Naganishia liquefaciens]|uniref:Uncharacterized protein n=1 Tax=Naganishia liquefaciens TaxID=104408 RepID=A0A8H3TQL2_9TREE|nr:hypothetical protein NliqN6_1556 [Naganishia liquefaciens]